MFENYKYIKNETKKDGFIDWIEGTATNLEYSGTKIPYHYLIWNYPSLLKFSAPNVKIIPRRTFYNCANLHTVELQNCEEINVDAFTLCPALKKIILGTKCIISNNSNSFNNLDKTSLTIYCNSEDVAWYVSQSCWEGFVIKSIGEDSDDT